MIGRPAIAESMVYAPSTKDQETPAHFVAEGHQA